MWRISSGLSFTLSGWWTPKRSGTLNEFDRVELPQHGAASHRTWVGAQGETVKAEGGTDRQMPDLPSRIGARRLALPLSSPMAFSRACVTYCRSLELIESSHSAINDVYRAVGSVANSSPVIMVTPNTIANSVESMIRLQRGKRSHANHSCGESHSLC